MNSYSSWVFSDFRATGSSVAGKHSAVLLGGTGTVGSMDDDDSPEANVGENVGEVESYGVPCIVWRPRAPETITTNGVDEELAAEGKAIRTGSGLVPVASRDLRLNRKYPAPKEGSSAFVGYGGGFLSFEDTPAKESLSTWYIPYANGTKCLTIALDPTTESIMIIQGDGYSITLDPDSGIVLRGDSSTRLQVKGGEITLIANKVILQGNVVVGANPAAAIPFAGGPAMLPCASFFLTAPTP